MDSTKDTLTRENSVESIEVTFIARHGENLSPYAEIGEPELRRELSHREAIGLMNQISNSATAQGIHSSRNKERKILKNVFAYGGGPLVDIHEYLIIIPPTIMALAAFMKSAQPIIIEYLKNRRLDLHVKYKNGTELRINGEESFDKIVSVIDKLQREKIKVEPKAKK